MPRKQRTAAETFTAEQLELLENEFDGFSGATKIDNEGQGAGMLASGIYGDDGTLYALKWYTLYFTKARKTYCAYTPELDVLCVVWR